MEAVDRLLGRTLVIVAHTDDECIAYGTLLQRISEPLVVFVTDSAPRDSYFWHRYGSRESYAKIRRLEAKNALRRVGVHAYEFLADTPELRDILVDQELYRNLPEAYGRLSATVERFHPEALATLAYEGGHPDHDCCSFLTALIGNDYGVPVWEAPLYRRVEQGGQVRRELGTQLFLGDTSGQVELQATPEELERKRAMCAEYSSQGDFLKIFDIEREVVRLQVRYDYSRRPYEGVLNYEAWQWPMTGEDVCRALVDFMRAHELRGRRKHA